MLNLWEWAKAQFGRVKLGNARRTERAVKVAAAMAERGPGKVPLQAKTFGEGECSKTLGEVGLEEVGWVLAWRDTNCRALGIPWWHANRSAHSRSCHLFRR